jgi:outer membrane lipoprotein SlyB
MTQEKTVERTTTTTEPATPAESVETTTVHGGHGHGDEQADGAVAGGAAGAVGGAVVGGPVGAVVGGAIGATAGATAGLADEETKDHDDSVVTQEVTRR